MTNRAQQQARIGRLQRGLIAAAVAGSLAIAGYLGLATSSTASTASDSRSGPGSGPGSDTGSGTGSTTSDNGGTRQFGDTSVDISPGSGPAHAMTSGS